MPRKTWDNTLPLPTCPSGLSRTQYLSKLARDLGLGLHSSVTCVVGSHGGYWLSRTRKARGVWLGQSYDDARHDLLRRAETRSRAEMKIQTTFVERIEITGASSESQAAFKHCEALGYRIIYSDLVKDSSMHFTDSFRLVGEKEVQVWLR